MSHVLNTTWNLRICKKYSQCAEVHKNNRLIVRIFDVWYMVGVDDQQKFWIDHKRHTKT